MQKPLDHYKITIDPEYADGDEDLGVEMIAFVKNPAVKVKGMAFAAAHAAEKLYFADEVKMRIAAPALIPMSIYRNDEAGEYYVQFTRDEIERIHAKFMANLDNRGKFNLEHDDQAIAPAYILEAWLVGADPTRDRSSAEFGIEVPTGTLFMVAQVTDRVYYDQLIANEQIGFSIEGFLGLKFSNHKPGDKPTGHNKSKQTMKKSLKKFAKAHRYTALAFAEGSLSPTGEITVVADELKTGTEALVIDENLEVIEDYTGEILIDDTMVTMEKGEITAVLGDDVAEELTVEEEVVKEEEAMKEEECEEDKEDDKMYTDGKAKMAALRKRLEDKEDEKKMAMPVAPGAKAGANPEEETQMAIDETELLTILQPKFDEIYKLIADLRIEHDNMLAPVVLEKETKPVTMAARLSAAVKFLNK